MADDLGNRNPEAGPVERSLSGTAAGDAVTLTVAGKRSDRFVQGTAMLDTLPRAVGLELLDGVAELGASTFDLAHAYGAGLSETLMGEWIRMHRTTRDHLFLITKGGHPVEGRGRITREEVRTDLEMSLARLGTDHVDLYLLHRDDEGVPTDEIVGFLDEVCGEGLVRAYGVSNWRHERFEAARTYARDHDLRQPVASSPHFSLAVPVHAPWPGCVSIAGDGGAAARSYYRREGVAVFAWSSLAMGFFGLSALTAESEPVAVGREQALSSGVFGSEANHARRERARMLARRDGDTPTQVAFRYVLSQQMTVQPIVGCRTVEEYAALRDASRRPLDEQTVRWLEFGDDAADTDPTGSRDSTKP